MIDLEKAIAEAKFRVDQAVKDKLKSEAAYEQAQESLEKIKEHLKQEYDVETADDAKKVLLRLKEEVQTKLGEILKGLDKLGL